MSFLDVLKAGNYKRVALVVYEEYLYPQAKAYVDDTKTPHDNAGLAYVDGFIRGFLKFPNPLSPAPLSPPAA